MRSARAIVSPIPEKLRWRTWAADDEGMTGDELLAFINNELFPGLKELALGPGDDPRGFVVRDVFVDSYNYMKSGTLLRQVINRINQIDFNACRTGTCSTTCTRRSCATCKARATRASITRPAR